MFADYRVPQILVNYEVLIYSENLKEKIQKNNILVHGGNEEVPKIVTINFRLR